MDRVRNKAIAYSGKLSGAGDTLRSPVTGRLFVLLQDRDREREHVNQVGALCRPERPERLQPAGLSAATLDLWRSGRAGQV